MAKTKILLRAAAPFLLAALVACDNPAGGGEAAGSIRMVYGGSSDQGIVSGTYQARGEPRLGPPLIQQTYALGQRYAADGHIQVVSNLEREGGTADFAWVTIPRLTPGTVSIDGICPGEDCASVFLALEVGTSGVSQARYSCSLDAGTIRVTTLTDTRVKGDFSGTGFCVGRAGTVDLDQFSIAEGTFDVRLVDIPG